MDTLHEYMQKLAREETRKRMDQKKARVACAENSEVTIPSAKKKNLPHFLLNVPEETEIESPEQDKYVAKPIKEKQMKRFVQKVKSVVKPIKEKQLKHFVQKVKSVAKPLKEKNFKHLVQSVSKNKSPILLAALGCAFSKRLVAALIGRRML
jgi:hypothetical protein